MDEMNQIQNQDENTPHKSGGSGLSIASMVLGIISLLTICFINYCLVLGISGIIFGGVSIYRKNQGKGFAIAGIVCSSIAIAGSVILTAVVLYGIHQFHVFWE